MSNSPNVRSLDAAYKAFPTFASWLKKSAVDNARWARLAKQLDERASVEPERLRSAFEIATRAAAIETGALEDLYQSDRGFTYSVASQATAWEMAVETRGDRVRPLFESQLAAYEYVLTLATKSEPISEASIRELHAQICSAQGTYRAYTAAGPQEQPLKKGVYKTFANHVHTRTGEDHSYAPVDDTPEEMHRLVLELRSEAFLSAHPVIQSAYAHYCLVVIHPFADGNGRVARALASCFTYRAARVPIVILAQDKEAYLDALGSADNGQFEAFTNFMLARSIDTFELVLESLRLPSKESAEDLLADIEAIYSSTELKRSDVDRIGRDFQGTVYAALVRSFLKLKSKANLDVQVESTTPALFDLVTVLKDSDLYREPEKDTSSIYLGLGTKEPASAAVHRYLSQRLPIEAHADSEIRLVFSDGSVAFSAVLSDLYPHITPAVELRASLFAERTLAQMLATLRPLAEASFKSKL